MVYKLPPMVDMARTPKDAMDSGLPIGLGMLHDRYPCGLSISLTNAELDKLDLDGEVEIGDMIHLFAFAKVTSVSETDGVNGKQCRIELQITHIGLEDEDEENEEAEEAEHERRDPTAKAERDIKRKLYDADRDDEEEEEEEYEPRAPEREDRAPRRKDHYEAPPEARSVTRKRLSPERAKAYSENGHEPARSKHGPEAVAARQYNGHSEDDLETRNARR